MKATVFYKDNGYRQCTISIAENEANAIVREFLRATRLPRNTYITRIRCGNRVYKWMGTAHDAFGGCKRRIAT